MSDLQGLSSNIVLIGFILIGIACVYLFYSNYKKTQELEDLQQQLRSIKDIFANQETFNLELQHKVIGLLQLNHTIPPQQQLETNIVSRQVNELPVKTIELDENKTILETVLESNNTILETQSDDVKTLEINNDLNDLKDLDQLDTPIDDSDDPILDDMSIEMDENTIVLGEVDTLDESKHEQDTDL